MVGDAQKTGFKKEGNLTILDNLLIILGLEKKKKVNFCGNFILRF